MSGFQMNPNLENELLRMIAPAVNDVADALQAALDKVSTEFSGRPVGEVKVALATAWADATPGGNISDPELTVAATAVSRGQRLRLEDRRLVAYGDSDE